MIPAWVPAATQGLKAWFVPKPRKRRFKKPQVSQQVKATTRAQLYRQMCGLRRIGLTYGRIAKILGVHRTTVQRHTWNVQRKWFLADKVCELRAEGMLWKDIAKKVGVALITIHRKRRQGYV